MAPSLRSTLDTLLRPRARHANDLSTSHQLNWRHRGPDLPKGLELQWLGTAGFRITYESFDLLVDPFLTRSDLLTVLGPRAIPPDEAVLRRVIPNANAILVGHTHYDHALDVPPLVRRCGCRAYGSTSLRNLLGAHGLADRATVVETGRVYEMGPFEVTFVESVHSKLFLGLKVPYDGELTCDHLDDLRGSAYRCGDVYGIHIAVAGTTFYHQGSADLIDSAVQHRDVDFFLMGIAGRGYTKNYVHRILSALSPRVVVPQHFDNFFRPIDHEMGFSLNVNLGGLVEEVHRVSQDFDIRTLDLLQSTSGT